jgi:GrpB-like predicted nucleotidyltransferase (UPF0157 family)
MDSLMATRIRDFTQAGIGLERGTVSLSSHNARWKRIFSRESYLLFDELRDESLRLYHCGSTSVPGIAAKPVIDILGSVKSLEYLDNRQHILKRLGYAYKGEYGIAGRRYCVLYNPEQTVAYVHLHLFQHDDPEVEKHLLFRDYLRSNPEAAQRYAEHKTSLVHEKKVSRDLYPELKNDLIQSLLKEAQLYKNKKPTVLAILSSAPGHKNTLHFLKESFGGEITEIIDLNDSPIHPYSYDSDQNRDRDSYLRLVRQIIASDYVVLATPVYWYSMSTLMKTFVDRFSDLLNGTHQPLGEALCGKKICVIATGSDPRLPIGFEVPFSATAIYFGMDYMGISYRAYDS